MERLPITGMYKVVEEDGSVKYVSEGRRFVFVGKMYDLWKGEAMSAGVKGNQKVNWNRNGVSIEKIGFPLGGQYGETTIVIAPDCEDCRGLVDLVLQTQNDDVNIVLLASNREGREANAMVWCSKDRVKGLQMVYLKGEKPRKEDLKTDCDQMGLMLADQAAQVFGIGVLPMVVDAEGNGHIGEQAIYAVSELRN